MAAYPQLASGALSQFPVRKTRRARTVVNQAADGSTIKLADPATQVTEWVLTYTDLSDEEAGALRAFFIAAEGTLNGFTFLDPAGNLLAWSDQLDEAAWQKDPLLSLTGSVADPRGGTSAWRLSNGGGAAQSAGQTLAAPGGYEYCLSAYVRAATATSVRLTVGSQGAARAATSDWTRIAWTSSGDAQATSVRFGMEIGAGDAVEVYGLQVEAQTAASGYKASTRGGVYEGAHLGDDVLTITSTSVNRNSCTVKIIHANHL
jgi:hypothetical protein